MAHPKHQGTKPGLLDLVGLQVVAHPLGNSHGVNLCFLDIRGLFLSILVHHGLHLAPSVEQGGNCSVDLQEKTSHKQKEKIFRGPHLFLAKGGRRRCELIFNITYLKSLRNFHKTSSFLPSSAHSSCALPSPLVSPALLTLRLTSLLLSCLFFTNF